MTCTEEHIAASDYMKNPVFIPAFPNRYAFLFTYSAELRKILNVTHLTHRIICFTVKNCLFDSTC